MLVASDACFTDSDKARKLGGFTWASLCAAHVYETVDLAPHAKSRIARVRGKLFFLFLFLFLM